MKKLKIGVIGAGSWGQNHIRVLSKLEKAVLVAVCDIDLSRVKKTAENYKIQAFTNFKELFKNKKIEAVSICTPTSTHFQIALEAFECNKHVFVEKPMVSNTNDAQKLLVKSKKTGLCLMVGFIERFNPGVQKVKNLIKNGECGEVVLAFAKRVSRWPKRIGDVGVVKDTAIHDLDILPYIFEKEPRSVYARMGKLQHKFEDYVQIMLKFSEVQTGFIEANWLTPHKTRTLTLTCENTHIFLDYLKQKIRIENDEGARVISPIWKEPLMLELQNFIVSVLSDREPFVTGTDGLKALTLAESAIDSARSNIVINTF